MVQTVMLLSPGGLLLGDDYSDDGTWGVKRAVREYAPNHVIYADWIWMADGDTMRNTAAENFNQPSLSVRLDGHVRRALFHMRARGRIEMELKMDVHR